MLMNGKSLGTETPLGMMELSRLRVWPPLLKAAVGAANNGACVSTALAPSTARRSPDGRDVHSAAGRVMERDWFEGRSWLRITLALARFPPVQGVSTSPGITSDG